MDERIETLQRICAARPGLTALGGGLPSENLFPRRQLADAAHRVIANAKGAALQYGWPEGQEALRDCIATRLRARGADVEKDDVIITAGAQQAIALAVNALLSEGMSIHVDAETYPAALDLFRAKKLHPTALLAGASACYLMQTISNPHGTGLRTEHRADLFTSGLPLIVDEAYAELRFDGYMERSLLCCARDRTWLIGTFSKTLAPGLRIGWLIAPRAYRDRVVHRKQEMDLQTSSLSQSVLAELLRTFDFDAHLGRARREYARRAEKLVAAVRKYLPMWDFEEPAGGFSIFVKTNCPGDDVKFLSEAASFGVSFDPGRLFRVNGTSSPIALRLSYSNIAEDEIEESVARLSKAWRVFAPSS